MALDLTYLSKRNDEYRKRTVTVANGTRLIALDMTEAKALDAREVLYLHINRENHKCYVGVTIMRAGDRWNGGIAYRFNRRFGAAIKKWGWYMFEHHILAFIDDRDAMNKAEIGWRPTSFNASHNATSVWTTSNAICTSAECTISPTTASASKTNSMAALSRSSPRTRHVARQ